LEVLRSARASIELADGILTEHRLRLIARVLKVSPSYFFEGIIAPVSEGVFSKSPRPGAQSASFPAPAV